MNKFLIQQNGLEKNTTNQIFRILERLEIPYEIFNSKEILKINISEKYNYITVGGVSFLRVSKHLPTKLKESVDYNIKSFDQETYQGLNLPLLNHGGEFYSFDDIKKRRFDKDKFIKPSKDLKSFNGGILKRYESLEEYIARTKGNINESKKESILISNLKEIFYEYRFFMYKDEILGCSRYKWNNVYSPSKIVPDYIKEKAIEYSKLYQPSDIFVIDLAETNKSIEIVEYQCWNISAFYESDLLNIIGRINEIKS